MKKIRVILLLFAGSIATPLMSQNDVSHLYTTLPETENTIVRNIKDYINIGYNTVTCCRLPDTGMVNYSHYFILRNNDSSFAKYFYFPTERNEYGLMHDKVYDMRILGKKCYFCGTRRYIAGYVALVSPPGSPTVYAPEYDSCGFFGYFNLPGTGSVDFSLKLIPEIKAAKRMTVFTHDSQRKVTLLGMTSNYSLGKTCLVHLSNDMMASFFNMHLWDYFVEYLYSDDEEMTDVITNGVYMVTSSVFSSDSHWVGFRYIKQDGAVVGFHAADPGSETFIYDLRDLETSGDCEVSKFDGASRISNSPVLLSPTEDGYVAAFCGKECHYQGGTLVPRNYDNVFMFSMESPMDLREIQTTCYGESSRLVDLTYVFNHHHVGILYSTYDYYPCPPGIQIHELFAMTLGIVNVGECYAVDKEYKYQGDILSIDAGGSTSMAFAGRMSNPQKPFDGSNYTFSSFGSHCLDGLYILDKNIGRLENISYNVQECLWEYTEHMYLRCPPVSLPLMYVESEDCGQNIEN